MRPINVLYLIDKLCIAGAQRHLSALVAHLDRSVINPQVCCLQYEGELAEELKQADIPVFSLGLRKIYNAKGVAGAVRLARIVRKSGVDVLHCYLLSAHLFGGFTAAICRAPALISSRRDLFSHAQGKYLWASRLANRFVHRIEANSHAVADFVARTEGFPAARISVIYNGVDLSHLDPSVGLPDFRSANSIDPSVPLIGTVANLKPMKAVDVFIRTAAILSRKLPEARFVIAGSGPLEREMRQLAHAEGLDARLLFAGSLEDVRPLLASLDVFMLLSQTEGMSNALLEAMAMAKAVVATRVGGNVEAIKAGETGLLVEAGDAEKAAAAALRLIGSPPLAGQLGKAARRVAELSFSVERMVADTQQLYRDVLSERGRFRRDRNAPAR